MPHIHAFLDAIASAGLTPPTEIIDDGKRHRFSSSGKPKDDTGWYILHGDDRPAGAFGCWRSGISVTWKHDAPKKEFSQAERDAWRKRVADVEAEREQERTDAAAYAAKTAAQMWAAAREDAAHDYLARKKIPAIGARVLKNMLLIPIKHSAREVVGLQRIWPDGTKRPIKGTPMVGAYTTLGAPTRTGTVVICEGYATGVSIHMATDWCVVVAFNSGNLGPVSAKIKAALPGARIIIAADDDAFTVYPENHPMAGQPWNPGMLAAGATGLPVAFPRWAGERDRDTDFNDLHLREGLDAVRACFHDPLEIIPPENTTATAEPATLKSSAQPASGMKAKNPGSAEAGAVFPLVDPTVHEGPPFEGVSMAALDDIPIDLPPPPGDTPPPRRERRASDDELPLIFASSPMKTANQFHSRLPDGGRILHWRGEFYSWDGTRYVVRDRVYIDQCLYLFMAGCMTLNSDQEPIEFNPKTSTVNDVAHALRAVTYADLPEPQCWIDQDDDDPPPGEIIAFGNGFLHWPTRELLPASDRLFVTNALEFDYNPAAGKPVEWLKFLDTLWPDDPESIMALADMFGYLLTDDTSQQKMFMLIGPPRCGKGTILRVLESMVGYHNRVSPSLASVGTQFGLQPLIGKRLAMISDARLSGKTDQQPIVENLLRVSGEDAVSIDRKHTAAWTGKLPTRFVLASNELPSFSDASAALANRFMLFRFTQSFLGREDHGLTARLLRELPGIVLWALDGLERLQERGYLIRPASSRGLADDLVEQTSPMRSFIAETCVIGEGFTCDRDELFKAWKAWCTDQGRDHAGTKISFGRQLASAYPTVSRTQPQENGVRKSCYSGMLMRASWEDGDEPL